MRKERMFLWLDCFLLCAVLLTEVRALTGVPLHEWIGVALTTGILLHLLLQWPWVESRTRRLVSQAGIRTRINYALIATMFLAMVAAIFSGFMLSNTVLPWLGRPLEERRTWHEIHEFTGHSIVFLAGLHLAVNWDWVKRLVRGRSGTKSSETRPSMGPRLAKTARNAAIIALAAAVVAVGTYGVDSYMKVSAGNEPVEGPPAGDLRREVPGQTRRPEYGKPPLSFGLRALAMIFVTLGVTGLVGRKVFRLRL